ncbi:hypothetical protein LPN04_06165 [Rugamonas sp. A1-17]|nr:hypothetical protein [Rugamonas sp. A1-17]
MAKKGLEEVVEQLEEDISTDSDPVIKSSGSSTAKKALDIMRDVKGFYVLTAAQRKKVIVKFAEKGYIIYGKAFDLVRVSGRLKPKFDDEKWIEKYFERITICEIKSTDKSSIPDSFKGYFFSISTAELLVAQSLKNKFLFIFVNVPNFVYDELRLQDIYSRTKNIYPSWSVSF